MNRRRYERGAWMARSVCREFGIVTIADAVALAGLLVLAGGTIALAVMP